MDAQLALLSAPWPFELLAHPRCAPVHVLASAAATQQIPGLFGLRSTRATQQQQQQVLTQQVLTQQEQALALQDMSTVRHNPLNLPPHTFHRYARFEGPG